MIYTQKIQNAIQFAIQTHEIDQKQKRKGKDVPYITHPLALGLILASAGANEDVIVAGILHDTIEDSIEGKKVTKEMIAEEFGQNVSDLVISVTEQDKSLSWEERKAEALEHIKTFSNDSLLLKSADIIANTSELLDDYKKEGKETFKRFNAPKERILKGYMESIDALLKKWSESPLVNDLENILEGIKSIAEMEEEVEFYLSPEVLKIRRIVYVACEDEEGCGFLVEFKFPNCTFFFCKEHRMGFNIDLNTVNDAGVVCELHGKMEQYNVLTEDNVCPRCEKNTLAILSAGIN
ncbi:HD domain-containing protein [Candidatus Nomurabacteria bacterium]|nr:HD domain-containing protein [Candidatus Nomurabacteria bacterium]